MIDFPCTEKCLKKSTNAHTKGCTMSNKRGCLKCKVRAFEAAFCCELRSSNTTGGSQNLYL